MNLEYIWIDGREGTPQLRSKTKVVYSEESIPDWGFDGGSTYQGTLQDSDRILKSVRVYADPFGAHTDKLVLCEVYYPDGTPHESNTRHSLSKKDVKELDPWFGFEQEYTLINPDTRKPIGFKNKDPNTVIQGDFYCSIGTSKAVGREIAEAHLGYCRLAGVALDGMNAEVMPGQWEYQTSPGGYLKAPDDAWMARYILERLSERYGVDISFNPKPHEAFNGAGMHTNFSTVKTREDYSYCIEVIESLKENHSEAIKIYGDGIERRLTGECETSPFTEFSFGVADRGASVRVPAHVYAAGKGYIEDRRPCANADPYKVCSHILECVATPVLS
mgnify:FL=1